MKTKMIQFANKIQRSRSRIFLYFVSNKIIKTKENICAQNIITRSKNNIQ